MGRAILEMNDADDNAKPGGDGGDLLVSLNKPLPGQMPWGTLVIDLDGVITQWSRPAAGLFGYPAAYALDRLFVEFIADEDHHNQVQGLIAATEAGQGWAGIIPIARPDGGECDIALRSQPATDRNGHVVAVLVAEQARASCTESAEEIQSGRAIMNTTASERLALLTEASVRIGATLELQQTAQEIIDVVVPRFCDAAGVLVLERLVTGDELPVGPAGDSVIVRRLAVGASDNSSEWFGVFPVGEVLTYPTSTPYAQCMATGQSVLFSPMEKQTAQKIGGTWRRARAIPLLAAHSLLLTPLIARRTVLGFIVLNRNPDSRAFHDHDVQTAREVAARAALCIDNARLYTRERNTALTLQRSLLPQEIPAANGLETASRYLPSSYVAEVGGDWFDVIPLSDSRVALVVGDVMGHGISAAATMGQLRTAVRTLANLEMSPAELLRHLDEMMLSLGDVPFATCLYAVYDAASQRCVLAKAGHVPPILLRPDGVSEILDLPSGAPLGLGGVTFQAREIDVASGSVLVLYTDGLVESRGRDISIGLTTLRKSLGDPARPLDDICEDVIAALHHEGNEDDTALLLARF